MNYSNHSKSKREKELESKTEKVKKSISTSFIRIIVLTILVSLGLVVCAGFGIAKAIIDSAPTIDYDQDIMPKEYRTFIYDQLGNKITTLHGTNANRIHSSLDQIPTYLQDAFIAIEDERFYEHNGIDIKGILRAIINNIKSKNLTGEGASTITQQVIKNNVLSNDQTFHRKIQEQYLAVELEKHVQKNIILESYLNTVALGRGTYGVQAASNKYFNKDVSELTLAESAVMASITKYPTRYDPISNPENNRARQLIVLEKMLEQNKITQKEYNKAVSEDVYTKIEITNKSTDNNYSYFVDEVIQRVKNDLVNKKGYTDEQAYDLIYTGGLNIYVTQDIDMQKIMDEEFLDESNYPPKSEDYSVKLMYTLSVNKNKSEIKHYYKEKEFSTDKAANEYAEELKASWITDNDEILSESRLLIPQPQASMVIIDHHNGHVKAITGGRGKKVGNQLLNRAVNTYRQPGSTFKILAAYLPAIDAGGYTLATVQDDVPFSYTFSEDSEPWEVNNWYDSNHYKYNYKGLSTVRDSITYSINIHAVKTLMDIGINKSFNYLMKLGFTSLIDRKVINNKVYSDKNYSLALGGITKGVNLLELTGAYGAIANNGKYIEPIFYTKVLDHDNNILLENKQPEEVQVMKESTAFLLTDAMTDVVEKGTGTVVKFNSVSMPIAGKTGTSSDKKDLVFAGYTPYYVASIWQGYDTPKEQAYKRSYHKILWRKIMEEIHKGLPRKEFYKPDNIITAKICTESGKLAQIGLCNEDPRGSTIITEYFEEGTEPTETCDVHVRKTICSASGLIATKYCPNSCKYSKVFIKRPEPLVPSTWDPNDPPRIQDRKYELNYTSYGEYCNIHGPYKSKINLPTDYINDTIDENASNEDDEFIAPEDKPLDNEIKITPYLDDDYYSPPPFIYQE